MAHKGTDIDTVIGSNTHIDGDVKFTGGLHIDGSVKGNVVAEGQAHLTLSEHGKIEGELRVPTAEVNGELDGDMHISERLQLAPKARITGNVHYHSIEMQLGAKVNGQLNVLDNKNVTNIPAKGDKSVKGAAKPEEKKNLS